MLGVLDSGESSQPELAADAAGLASTVERCDARAERIALG